MGPSGFILAAGLAVVGTNSDRDTQKQYFNASRQAAEAAYIDSGLKPMMDRTFQDLERRYVPKELEKFGSVTVIAIKAASERRLFFSYEF